MVVAVVVVVAVMSLFVRGGSGGGRVSIDDVRLVPLLVRCLDSIPEAKLGDFGAAFFYPHSAEGEGSSSGSPVVSAPTKYEALEVRAFGCLIDELTARLQAGASADVVASLSALSARCVQPAVALRPTFAVVAAELSRLVDTVKALAR